MGTAKQPGGLYYVGGVAVDSEGKPIEGAPELGPETPASEQPGAPGTGTTPEEKLANAIVAATAAARNSGTTAPRVAAEPQTGVGTTGTGVGATTKKPSARKRGSKK